MKVAAVLALFIAGAYGATTYVWDIIKPPLTTNEVMDIIHNAIPGVTFPIYSSIPNTGFQCSKQKFPGFYSDVDAQCQVFHRCDSDGTETSYLCPNTTIFDQIRLVCDYFFNVDCKSGAKYVEFANSRLYTLQNLFDTPPADYVVPWLRNGEAQPRILVPAPQKKITATSVPEASVETTQATAETTTAEEATTAGETTEIANKDTTAAAGSSETPTENTTPAAETTEAATEVSTTVSEETTAAASKTTAHTGKIRVGGQASISSSFKS